MKKRILRMKDDFGARDKRLSNPVVATELYGGLYLLRSMLLWAFYDKAETEMQ